VTVYFNEAIWIALAAEFPAGGLLAFLQHWKAIRERMHAFRAALAFASCRRVRMSDRCGTRCPLELTREDKAMFDSINDLAAKLRATGYFIDL